MSTSMNGLIAVANPDARVLVGTPTWPNHPPIIEAVRLERVDYPYYERGQGAIRFEDMIAALEAGRPGDVALLHGCCHNPTGADLSEDQWREVVRAVSERGLLPLIDIAYQGFGRGLDEDAFGVRLMLDACIPSETRVEIWTRAENDQQLLETVRRFATPHKTGILIVDDEEPVRNMVDLALRYHGFHSWKAATGAEAVELYRQHQADIALHL